MLSTISVFMFFHLYNIYAIDKFYSRIIVFVKIKKKSNKYYLHKICHFLYNDFKTFFPLQFKNPAKKNVPRRLKFGTGLKSRGLYTYFQNHQPADP